MAKNKGKAFEDRFKHNWKDTVPDSLCYRLIDVTTGFAGIKNVADFICYKYPLIFLIDCKSHSGGTISFNDFSQYDEMLEYKNIKGVYAGTVIWFYEKDVVCWVPIETWEQLKKEDKKSFNVKYLDMPEYKTFTIPSKKLRTFMDSDYSKFIEYITGDFNGTDR